eukprot:15352072-Ditylum_brightwellii.AAC.1
MVQFGMKSMLVNFGDKFYVYKGAAKGKNLTADGIALAIGGMLFQGIYQDDGLVVFKEKWMKRMLAKWLVDFQSVVDKIEGGDYLQFTTELWYLDANGDPYLDGEEEKGEEVAQSIWKSVKVSDDESFPFLDMEMQWKSRKQFSRLASRAKELDLVKIGSVYLDHAKALLIADVAPEIFPTFREIWKKEDEASTNQEGRQRRERRATYFLGGYINFIHNANIPKLIKALQKRYNLKWIRISMAYWRFLNMREHFSGGLGEKLTRGLVSRDFMCRPCNCNVRSKALYIGVVQDGFKQQITGHTTLLKNI